MKFGHIRNLSYRSRILRFNKLIYKMYVIMISDVFQSVRLLLYETTKYCLLCKTRAKNRCQLVLENSLNGDATKGPTTLDDSCPLLLLSLHCMSVCLSASLFMPPRSHHMLIYLSFACFITKQLRIRNPRSKYFTITYRFIVNRSVYVLTDKFIIC